MGGVKASRGKLQFQGAKAKLLPSKLAASAVQDFTPFLIIHLLFAAETETACYDLEGGFMCN